MRGRRALALRDQRESQPGRLGRGDGQRRRLRWPFRVSDDCNQFDVPEEVIGRGSQKRRRLLVERPPTLPRWPSGISEDRNKGYRAIFGLLEGAALVLPDQRGSQHVCVVCVELLPLGCAGLPETVRIATPVSASAGPASAAPELRRCVAVARWVSIRVSFSAVRTRS
jgi:hypothetical protein